MHELTKSRNSLPDGIHKAGDKYTCPLGIKWKVGWIDVGDAIRLTWATEPISII